jgi:uncharacterized protein YbjQ (UPF0145 family)
MSTQPPTTPPTAPPPNQAPNWYPDPQNPSQWRYWDGTRWTEHVSAAQQAAGIAPQPGAINAPLAQYAGPPILITTMNDLPGYEIEQVHGEIFGLIVRARNVFANFGAGLRTVFGGEATGYTQLLANSRHEAIARLKHAANEKGANAVIAMRFDCNEIADVMSEVAAYGTAVTVRKTDGSGPPDTST